MLRIHTAVLALTLPVLFLGACASHRPPAGSRARPNCVNTREINVMRPLDDRHVFVRASANRNYLFSTQDRCPGLHLARRLSIWEGGTRVCADGASLLAFEDPTVGEMRCAIAQIERVKDLATAEEMTEAESPRR